MQVRGSAVTVSGMLKRRVEVLFGYSAADFDTRKPPFFLIDLWYTVNEASGVQFRLFVFDKMNRQVPVSIEPMLPSDAEATNLPRVWQTSWTSKYLAEERFDSRRLDLQPHGI